MSQSLMHLNFPTPSDTWKRKKDSLQNKRKFDSTLGAFAKEVESYQFETKPEYLYYRLQTLFSKMPKTIKQIEIAKHRANFTLHKAPFLEIFLYACWSF